jgi:hypothetical protein
MEIILSMPDQLTKDLLMADLLDMAWKYQMDVRLQADEIEYVVFTDPRWYGGREIKQ